MMRRSGDRSTDPRGDADEARLVAGIAAGRRDAIGRFLERTHHPVYCMAARLTPDVELRTEWAHDVLLGVMKDLELGRFTYTRPGSFWAWFKKRAYFRLLDRYRERRRRGDREVAQPDAIERFAGGVDAPDAELDRAELRGALESCLESLANEDHRRALWHFLIEDVAYADVAERLGAPLNTVRAWIRRGRAALRRCLAERLEIELP